MFKFTYNTTTEPDMPNRDKDIKQPESSGVRIEGKKSLDNYLPGESSLNIYQRLVPGLQR